MKKIFIYILSGLIPSLLLAQMGKPYEMNINGVKVIVQPSGNEIVEIVTVIKGGVQNYPANKAGIETLAISALTECGTLKDEKNSFKKPLRQTIYQSIFIYYHCRHPFNNCAKLR